MADSAWSKPNPRCAIQTPELLEKHMEKEDDGAKAQNVDKPTGNQKEPTKSSRRSRGINVALIGALAGVYTVATIALGTLSYGPLNLRLSNVLIGTVPILGWPAIFGIALGVFLSNIGSPLGPIDLFSAAFSFIGLIAIHLLRNKSVLAGLAIYSLIISLW